MRSSDRSRFVSSGEKLGGVAYSACGASFPLQKVPLVSEPFS